MDKLYSTNDDLLVRKSGERAKRKHHYLKNYCGITTVSMRNKFNLVYLDVMAGPGRCKIEETNEEFPGSPLVALDYDFAEYIFIEEDEESVDALKKRVACHPKAHKVKVIPENWIKVVESGHVSAMISRICCSSAGFRPPVIRQGIPSRFCACAITAFQRSANQYLSGLAEPG